MKRERYLVVGLGSVGRRHARNLRALGRSVSGIDPRLDRIQKACAEGALCETYQHLETALEKDWTGIIIGSPTSFHVDQIKAVCERTKAWVLAEKPLGMSAAEAEVLLPHAHRILLGYTYRWWPPIQAFRKQLQSGVLGRLLHLRGVMSAHLADWHPWERYQDFFMSSRSLGGGALLDESHLVDLALWFGVRPTKVAAFVDTISDLEIDADDHVDLLLRGQEGEHVNLHLDIYGRPHERGLTAVCTEGSISYSYETNQVLVSRGKETETFSFDCERNLMFEGVVEEFIALCNGEASLTCTVEDGLLVLRVLDAARRSSAEGTVVSLSIDRTSP